MKVHVYPLDPVRFIRGEDKQVVFYITGTGEELRKVAEKLRKKGFKPRKKSAHHYLLVASVSEVQKVKQVVGNANVFPVVQKVLSPAEVIINA